MPTRVRSFSKVNLGLAVGPPRADGFHGLSTLYQTIGLHDDVTVTARLLPPGTASRITLECLRDGVAARGVPQTATGDAERNTAWRIVDGALRRLGRMAEVHIAIGKRLPVQGGLGAGSANAAAALIALENELGLRGGDRGSVRLPERPADQSVHGLSGPQRLALAAETGSDVPLFLLGGSVLGTGRGEQVFPLPDVAGAGVRVPCVVAVPGVGVSTRLAFAALDRRFAAGATLTSPAAVDKLEQLSHTLSAAFMASSAGQGSSGIIPAAGSGNGQNDSLASFISAKGTEGDLAETSASQSQSWFDGDAPLLALVRTGIPNDFEEVAFGQHPFLRDLKQELVGSGPGGAVYAALSGSGAALFGLYRTVADAEQAQQRIQQAGAAALLTETLPRDAYWRQMFVN